MASLGVNVGSIAALRQIGGGREPDPLQAAVVSELAGAEGIVAHLREDRRDIQDRDVYLLKQIATTEFCLEIAPVQEMIQLALDVAPHTVTIVPERREGKSAEAGIPVRGKERELAKLVETFQEHNIAVTLFVDPDIQELKSVGRTGASRIRLNTSYYAYARGRAASDELERIRSAAMAATHLDLTTYAGSGLNYRNVGQLAALNELEKITIDRFIIGGSIVSRAAIAGMDNAVRDMISLL